jgi:coproporphyrinogen III oxidase/oxygen-independent coproporphyrinogen-3 oxidase
MIISNDLLKKYSISAPRYTTYPTIQYWTDNPSTEDWIDSLNRTLEKTNSTLSIYIHLPFCENLCTFCGCSTSITKNHSVEILYIQALEKELDLYLEKVPALSSTELIELNLGGGTPTFFSEDHLEKLISLILNKIKVSKIAEFSIEIDPRVTRLSQVETLFKKGFRIISIGVQDFDLEVQKIINRNQSFEVTKKIIDFSREIGFNSINIDLIYGLPKQTISSMKKTLELSLHLKPDRITFYSYAHVPWIKDSQRLYTENDLPNEDEKRKLYETGRLFLQNSGYHEIGMDKYVLQDDSLWNSYINKKLHRNLMGYTSVKSDLVLGLGTSAISESSDCYHQNEKIEVKYRKILSEGKIPTLKGHTLNQSDIMYKELLSKLITIGEVEVPEVILEDCKDYLYVLQSDGLIQWNNSSLKITEIGKPFLKIICTVFDKKLREFLGNKKIFKN